jgi:hypothetical protein
LIGENFMTKIGAKWLVGVTLLLGMVALVVFGLWSAQAGSMEQPAEITCTNAPAFIGPTFPLLTVNLPAAPDPQLVTAIPVSAPVPASTPAPESSAILNARHRFALGMIETANNDGEIGGAGEVSRYQIMPSVWKHYSESRNYQNPEVSLEVAQRHWSALHDTFVKQAHREPTDFDMYVLWNTRYGYYASKGFNPVRLHPVVRDRAQRFVNLVERGES